MSFIAVNRKTREAFYPSDEAPSGAEVDVVTITADGATAKQAFDGLEWRLRQFKQDGRQLREYLELRKKFEKGNE